MKSYLTILFLSLGLIAFSQTSPFNKKEVNPDSTGNYEFIVSGHFYGNSSNTTGYPVNTLLGNVDNFNASNSSFIMCLGDLFLDVKHDIPFYEKTLFTNLEIPLFNSVGNHDVSGTVYEDKYGSRTNLFLINSDCHLIIDTEVDNGNLEEEQLALLNEAKSLAKKGTIQNLFVYGHRTLWVEHYPEMDGLFADNTQSLTGNNFKSEVIPVLEDIGKYGDVYWFAGSLGNAPASFFYHNDEERNIQYIATAIRGLPRDAVLHVNSNQSEVTFELESLTGKDLLKLEDYNVEFWKENGNVTPPFNWRLVPLYIKNILASRYFWYGFLTVLVLIIIGRPILKKLRKRRANS